MTRAYPDLARNACAVVALDFGGTSIYALDPSVGCDHVAATVFALIGLWFALAAAADAFIPVSNDAVV